MFYFTEIADMQVLKSDITEKFNCFFTTRDSFIKTKDPNHFDAAEKHLLKFENFYGLSEILSPKQEHTDNVEVVLSNKKEYPNCDGLILADYGVGIFLNFADCTPVVFFDETKNIAAIAHAGWRGTALSVVKKTYFKMNSVFGCAADDIKCIIGPCIGYECFETSIEVGDKLLLTVEDKSGVIKSVREKCYADLKEINRRQLSEIGIKNVDVTKFCTVCNNDKFFSYRKNDKTTDRISAFVCLK